MTFRHALENRHLSKLSCISGMSGAPPTTLAYFHRFTSHNPLGVSRPNLRNLAHNPY